MKGCWFNMWVSHHDRSICLECKGTDTTYRGRDRNGEWHVSAKKVHINWKITKGFITYSLASLFDSRCIYYGGVPGVPEPVRALLPTVLLCYGFQMSCKVMEYELPPCSRICIRWKKGQAKGRYKLGYICPWPDQRLKGRLSNIF